MARTKRGRKPKLPVEKSKQEASKPSLSKKKFRSLKNRKPRVTDAKSSTHHRFNTRSKKSVKFAASEKPVPSKKPAVSDKMAESSKAKDAGPVYFWKMTQDHGYMCQWFTSPWTWEDEVYTTAEMWMMVQKARMFNDEETAKQILTRKNPAQQKALGRKVKNFDEKLWDDNKFRIVEEGNYLKFTVSRDAKALREKLLATGDRELVEASPLDRVWGVGFTASEAGQNREMWGENLLGKALTNVRKKLREETVIEKKVAKMREKEKASLLK